MNQYTPQDKLEFQRKEQWIAFESVLRTLCEFYKGEKLAVLDISERAKVVVEWMEAQWPMAEIKDEPFPNTQMPNSKRCPACGEQMKRIPEGVSKKTGKPYQSFWSCGACKKTAN